MSATNGDYPLGAGVTVRTTVTADGTHSFNAAGDFKYNNTTNIATNATDTFTYVDDLLTGITDYIAAVAASAGEYVEWTMGSLPFTATTINGVEVVSAHHSSGTAANKQSLRMMDGATASDVLVDADFSNTGIGYNSTHYAVAPSTSGAWTQALVQALKFRWSPSFTAVLETPVPFIDGLMLEVDCVATSTPIVSMSLQTALMCFTINALITINVGGASFGANPASAFVSRVRADRDLVQRHTAGNPEDPSS